MKMIKNIIFDIGGIVTREEEANAFKYLDEKTQKEINDIVFFNDGFNEVILRKYFN